MGHWSAIKPKGLSKRHGKHPWVFACYTETPSEREDKQWYAAFLFRNAERTTFGIHENVGRLPHMKELRQMATRVVTDESFRESLVSEAPALPELWKKR